MTTVDVSVAASGDDTNRYSGGLDITLDSLYIGSDGAPNHDSLRFQIPVPAGATVTASYFTFIAASTQAATAVNCNIYYEDANSPAAPTTSGDFDGRTLSSAVVAWNNIAAQVVSLSYNSPSLNDLLNALFAEAYWAENEYAQFFINDNSSTVNAVRLVASWDHPTYAAPLLHIEYTAGGGAATRKFQRASVLG